jgi:hypothetical protein
MTASSMNCTASVYHVWVRAVIGPALRRSAAVWIGSGIVAAVIFGPTAMQPHDLTSLALHDPGAGAVLAATWLLMFVPTARILVRADQATYLRSLPHGPTWPIAVVALVALQLPWLVLWALGEGARGLGVVAVLTVPIALLAAWRPRRRRAAVPRWAGGRRALAAVYARGVVRKGGDALVRGVGLAILAGLAGAMLVRNNALVGIHAGVMASAVIAIVLVPAAAGALLPLADAHRSADPLAASLGVATRAPLAIVVAGVYAIAGVVATTVAVSVTGNALIAPLVLATAIAIGLMIVPSLSGPPAKIIVRAVVATAVAVVLLGWLGATGAALAVVTGFVAVLS